MEELGAGPVRDDRRLNGITHGDNATSGGDGGTVLASSDGSGVGGGRKPATKRTSRRAHGGEGTSRSAPAHDPYFIRRVEWVARESGRPPVSWVRRYGGGSYVVVGDKGTILTSADGSEWARKGLRNRRRRQLA